MQAGETLVLVDGSSLAFRAFFALFKSGLRRADGLPTWAVYGFFNSLFDLLERKHPEGMAISFDVAGPTFRHDDYAEYKAHRPEMPDDLAVQWPIIKEGVHLLGIPLYEKEGFEADDVIGTVAKLAESAGIQVQIYTGDHDAFQLVDNVSRSIKVLMPGRPGKGEILEYGRAEVFEKLGVFPEQVIDYKGLCGDNSDNIPGVRGIGPVTAVQLLANYKTIEGIYEHLDEIKSKSVKQKLVDGRESAFASKALATIRLDVPLNFDFGHCQLRIPSIEIVSQFFEALEFKSLNKRLAKILGLFDVEGQGVGEAVSQQVSAAGSILTDEREKSGLAGKLVNAGVGQNNKSTNIFDHQNNKSATSTLPLTSEFLAETTSEPLLITNEADLLKLINDLKRHGVFALEVEGKGDTALTSEIVGCAFAWSKGLSLNDDRTLALSENDREASSVHTAYLPIGESGQLSADLVFEKLKPLLEDVKLGKIVHNAKFKMNCLSLQDITLKQVVFDPMLTSYVINPDEKHSLKDQAERLLGYSTVRARESAGLTKKQLTISFNSIDKVASCASDDARIIIELASYYYERLNSDQKYLLQEMELPLSSVLARMEQNGVGLDLHYLAQLSAELSKDLNRLESEIYNLAGHPFNINSTQQLQKVLFEELNLKSKGKTKTGYSTDASVLEALKDEHEIIKRILEYRQLSKLRSTYVDSLPAQVSSRSKRLHGEFNQAATSTGRLSSSNPNLQNIPIRSEIGRRIRRAFVPSQSTSVIVSADYSQIELRLLAHMSGDELLIDAFQKNQDIHARTASEIFDVPLAEVTADMRRIGKTLNFALIYQQGPYATAQDLGISTKEAQAFIDKYFSRYPKVRSFLNRTIEEARERGFVSTLWGRQRHFRFLNDRSDPVRKADERAACNAPLQGSAADLMKLAMIRLDRALDEHKLKAKLIMQVHDELVLEVPKNELEEAKRLVQEAMELDQPFKVSLRVDIGVAANWMEAK